jgi:hypothetical protein
MKGDIIKEKRKSKINERKEKNNRKTHKRKKKIK